MRLRYLILIKWNTSEGSETKFELADSIKEAKAIVDQYADYQCVGRRELQNFSILKVKDVTTEFYERV